jgi:hypothetical protein
MASAMRYHPLSVTDSQMSTDTLSPAGKDISKSPHPKNTGFERQFHDQQPQHTGFTNFENTTAKAQPQKMGAAAEALLKKA